MKWIRNLFVLIILLGILLLAGKNVIVKAAIEKGTQAVTGLPLQMDGFNMSLTKGSVDVDNLRLYNPKNFPDPVMVDIPDIYADVAWAPLLQKKVQIEEIRFHLRELLVVKNKDGELNIDSLKSVQAAKEEGKEKAPRKKKPAPKIALQIDKMVLRMEKVVYKDYSGGKEPNVREFKININEEFTNITDPMKVGQIIVFKAMKNTALASLTGFDLGMLQDGLGTTLATSKQLAANTLGKASELTGEASELAKKTTGTVKDTAESLKDTASSLKDKLPSFGFGSKE